MYVCMNYSRHFVDQIQIEVVAAALRVLLLCVRKMTAGAATLSNVNVFFLNATKVAKTKFATMMYWR